MVHNAEEQKEKGAPEQKAEMRPQSRGVGETKENTTQTFAPQPFSHKHQVYCEQNG